MKKPNPVLTYVIILLVALLFNVNVAQQQHIKHLAAKIDKMMSEQFKPNEPGAVALVARGGKIIYKKAFGMANMELNVPMRTDNVFRIGSITKQFTAVAILQLMEQGKMDLQDEITRFIPDYPMQGNRITIEHLLTHTSGIRNFSSIRDTLKRESVDFTPEEMIDYFKNYPIRFSPGTKWEYSNSNYFLLGYIIEKITGTTYREYMEENIFKPLGMTSSMYGSDKPLVINRAYGYTKGDYGFENASYISMTKPYAAGALQSSVEDLFKWNRAVHSYQVIKKENLDKALKRYTLTTGKETNYGYGWRMGFIRDSPSFWHGGLINGYITMAMYLPKEDVFVAVFSNCDCNSPEDITAKIAALAIGKPYEYTAIPVDNVLLARYQGVYENEKGQQRIITLLGKKLYSQLGRGPKFVVNAYQRDKFFFDDNAMLTIEFVSNSKGEFDKLITKNREGNDVWNKMDTPIPSEDGIQLDEKILESFVGVYEMTPEFTFYVTKDHNRLFVQATGQEKFEIFAETKIKFFAKINDAQFEFNRDNAGNVTKVMLSQGGRKTDAKKIK